jgi:hypothetical protein
MSAYKLRIAVRQRRNLRDEVVVRLSRGSELVLQSEEITWGTEVPANFANQIAPVACLVSDPLVAFPSRNVREDLTSRLDHAHGHGQLHHESIVNGYSDMSGPTVFGPTGNPINY